MTLMVDVEEAAERLPEMLAEVEAGREVLIVRGPDPIAWITSRPPQSHDLNVAAQIRAGRRDFAPTAIDEILAWKDEGRR